MIDQVGQSSQEAEKRALKRYEELLDGIASLARTLGTARDLTAIFRSLLEFTLQSMPCTAMCVTLYDPERGERRPHFIWADGEEMDTAEAPSFPVERGPAGRAITTGQVVVSNDFLRELEGHKAILLGNWEEDRWPASALFAPMTVMGRTIGAVEIQTYQEDAYRQEHTTVMRMAANLAANAVENVRLRGRERDHEDELRQAQKMEAVGRLASGVAHDFNNVLTTFFGNCDILMRELGPGHRLLQHVLEIKEAGDRASSLTRQLLAFSRRQVLEPVLVDLNGLVTDFARTLGTLIGADIRVVIKRCEQLPPVKCDPHQVYQILMNLIVNARDAMPEGGKLMIETAKVYLGQGHIRSHPAVKPGLHVMLSVTDTGCGMDEETRQHVFEPFFTTKEVGEGTGLGLSTVYGIVKQSGGSIRVESEPGRGATFKIYFPAAAGEVSRPRHKTEPEVAEARPGTGTILLAEDDRTVRDVITDALKLNGYRVIEASNGLEAIDAFRRNRQEIRLVITDMLMPQMNGRELAQLISGIDPTVPLLYMSGYPGETVTRQGQASDQVTLIEKPFQTHELVKKVREKLDQVAMAAIPEPGATAGVSGHTKDVNPRQR